MWGYVVDVPELAGGDAASDGDSLTSDNAALAALGYKQEFKRAFHPFEVFGIGFSVMGLFPSISSVLVYALPYGGPVALVWGWALCSIFLMSIALALAELGSSAPTSGGLYYWTWTFASPRWRKLLSWIVGYSNSIGLVAGITAVDWGCAVQLMAAVSIGTGGHFSPTTGQIYAVFAALLVCHGIVASLATAVIARLQGFYTALNVLLCLVIIIALPAATQKEFRNSPSYAFTGFNNLYAWSNGFAFVLSFLLPLWTTGGLDASIHLSEEAANARTAVPWALVSVVGISSILGFIINIIIALYMGTDLEGILSSPIGQPMATILLNSLGKRGMLAVWSVVVLVQFMMGSSSLIVVSRQVFAFSRDQALPFSRMLCRVNARTQTPVNAVWASIIVALLLGLIPFAGPSASSAIFSLGLAGQYTAFSVPIVSRFLGGKVWSPGPFSLGRLGAPVAIVAVAWMIFSVIILAFPAAPGPDAQGMNYMIVVFGGWISLCLVYYYFPVYGGACWFKGPRPTIEEKGQTNISRESNPNDREPHEKA